LVVPVAAIRGSSPSSGVSLQEKGAVRNDCKLIYTARPQKQLRPERRFATTKQARTILFQAATAYYFNTTRHDSKFSRKTYSGHSLQRL
jgi:hypothetical protein